MESRFELMVIDLLNQPMPTLPDLPGRVHELRDEDDDQPQRSLSADMPPELVALLSGGGAG